MTNLIGHAFTGPRAALGMTWEGVPSIRVLLSDSGSASPGNGDGHHEGSSSQQHGTKITRRSATLLKHPAQVNKHVNAWINE